MQLHSTQLQQPHESSISSNQSRLDDEDDWQKGQQQRPASSRVTANQTKQQRPNQDHCISSSTATTDSNKTEMVTMISAVLIDQEEQEVLMKMTEREDDATGGCYPQRPRDRGGRC